MQFVEILLLAAVAGVVLYQLYAVLGRRAGRQPEDNPEAATARAPLDAPPPGRPALDSAALGGVPAIKAKDGAFDIERFVQGARSAFEMIVAAFATGDRETLRPLLSAEVMAAFEQVMAQREAEGRSETVEFLQPPRADVEDSLVAGDVARIKVRFLAEFRSRSKGPEGEAVDDRRTAEVWTFERPAVSKDPNWTLTRVEAAEA